MPFLLFFVLLTFTAVCNSKPTIKDFLKFPLLRKIPSTPAELLSSDTHRLSILFSAIHGCRALKALLISGASTGSGQYFVHLQIGSPPQNLLLVADTGSDLVWVKCSACKNCSSHFHRSIFLPRHSSTFLPQHCYDSSCSLVPHLKPGHLCNHTRLHNLCRYEYSYANGSITSGIFSKETTTLKTSYGILRSNGNLKKSLMVGLELQTAVKVRRKKKSKKGT